MNVFIHLVSKMNVTSNATVPANRPWNTCHHLMSTDTMMAFDFALNCAVMPTITLLLGVPGNALCLCVFWKVAP